MLTHQVLDVERHSPTLLNIRFGLESRHSALCDPIGHNPIDLAIGDALHCFVGQIGRLDFHICGDLSLGLAIFSVTRSAVFVEEGFPATDILASGAQRVLQLFSACRRVRVTMSFVCGGVLHKACGPQAC